MQPSLGDYIQTHILPNPQAGQDWTDRRVAVVLSFFFLCTTRDSDLQVMVIMTQIKRMNQLRDVFLSLKYHILKKHISSNTWYMWMFYILNNYWKLVAVNSVCVGGRNITKQKWHVSRLMSTFTNQDTQNNLNFPLDMYFYQKTVQNSICGLVCTRGLPQSKPQRPGEEQQNWTCALSGFMRKKKWTWNCRENIDLT